MFNNTCGFQISKLILLLFNLLIIENKAIEFLVSKSRFDEPGQLTMRQPKTNSGERGERASRIWLTVDSPNELRGFLTHVLGNYVRLKKK